MKTSKLFLGSALLIALSTTAAFAVDPTADTVITMDVPAVCLIAVDDAHISLAVIKATAAGGASSASEAHATAQYMITNNNLLLDSPTKKIMASMPANGLPVGVSLAVNLVKTDHSSTQVETQTFISSAEIQSKAVLTGIGNVSDTKAITFVLSADDTAYETPASSPTVTVTLTLSAT